MIYLFTIPLLSHNTRSLDLSGTPHLAGTPHRPVLPPKTVDCAPLKARPQEKGQSPGHGLVLQDEGSVFWRKHLCFF